MDERSDRNYRALAFIPMLTSLGLCVGYRVVFAIMGTENPFEEMPHYVAAMVAIVIAMIFYDRNIPISKKIDVYCKGAEDSGIMLLGAIVLITGGFSSVVTAVDGKEPIVNMGLTLIPSHFLIPGIFIVTCSTSTCINTSMRTQVAVILIAVAMAQDASFNVAMAGATIIAGAYSDDNLSMISGTTICATKGVGAEMKDKFKINFLVALPTAVITTVLYSALGANGDGPVDTKELRYSILEVLPYLTVSVTAITSLDVPLVLLIGILMSGVTGIMMGTVTFFEWTIAMDAGMGEIFFLTVLSVLVSGLIELIKYYGGIAWLVKAMTEKIKNRKGCGYLVSLVSMTMSGTTSSNPVAIIITAPVARELDSKCRIALKRLAGLLDVFSCGILMLVPHDSNILLVQQYGGVTYLEIVHFAFYPTLLILFTCITTQFGLLRTKEERESGL